MTKPVALAVGFALFLFCVFMGYMSVIYGAWVVEKPIRAALLPVAFVLSVLLIVDKSMLFLLLILVRAPIDPILEAARFGSMSAGAVMNVLVLLIAFLLFVERPRVVSRTIIPMWAPLVLIMLFEAARAAELFQGARTFMSYLTYAAVFTVPFYLKQCQKDMRFCIHLVLLSSLIPAFYGFVDYAQGGYGGMYGDRISSTLGHPNVFAFYLVIVISLAFYLLKSPIMKTSVAGRWLLTLYIGILMLELVLTKTRSAWAACFVTFLVYAMIFERKYLIYIALTSVLALLVPAVQDRLMDLNTGDAYWTVGLPANSYDWRRMLWESAWAWMKLSALPLGYGLDSFAHYAPDFFPLANNVAWSAHNVYLQWLFEAGVVGLLCLGWLFWRLLSLLRSGIKDDKLGSVIMMMVVIEYLVVCYSDNMLGYLAFNWYFWFVLGTACSIIVARQAQTRGKALNGGSFPGRPDRIVPKHDGLITG